MLTVAGGRGCAARGCARARQVHYNANKPRPQGAATASHPCHPRFCQGGARKVVSAGLRGVRMPGSVLLLLVAALLLVGRGVGYPTFSGLQVWPKPREHSWVGEGRGPLRIEGSVASRDVDSSCGERVGSILENTMAPLVTSRVHDTITNDRTWTPAAYAEIDAVCPAAARCSHDDDCDGESACLVDPTRGRPWNSTHHCNPRSNADIDCGCCDSVVVSLSRVEVTCNDEGLQDEGPEAYMLEVTEDAGGTAKVSIRASAEHGAFP